MAKATKKQALGRGLSAILNDKNNPAIENNSNLLIANIGSIIDIPTEYISTNPFQPRSNFKEDSLKELASSIDKLGIIQPITVRKISNNEFQLVSGERRYRASKLLKLSSIPAYVRKANDHELLEMALVENIQRKDLDPIEIALSYKRLIDEVKLTQDQMSQRVGKKRSTIANYLRLLKLDPIIQSGIRDRFIGMGHGRAIVNIINLKDQLSVYEKVIKNKLSVRETEAISSVINNDNKIKFKSSTTLPSYIKIGINTLSSFFGHNIQVKLNKKGNGNISIPFHSKEDYNRIIKLLKK
tara:strand:+ start:1267 stop:2160 length:894 start_codon:yes stop_codon:yes gene_type:complete